MQNSNSTGRIAEVSSNLKLPDSDNLLDFIKSNLKPIEEAHTPTQAAAQVGAQNIVDASTATVVVKAPEAEPKVVIPGTTPAEPLTVNQAPAQVSDDVADMLDIGDKDKSWKGLRQQVTRTKNELTEAQRVLQEKDAYIEKIKKGEEEIEPVKVLREENQKLTKYRDMYDLETSPEYIQTYIEPVNAAKERLKTYAEEYSVPVEELEGLLEAGSESTINRYLSEHFDAIGGVEVKSILTDVRKRVSGRVEALAAPKQTLDKLRNDSIEATRQQDFQRVEKIKTVATSSYNVVSKVLEDSGKYPELTKRGDPHHDGYVDMVKENIAKSYGETITELGNLGLKDLPDALANKLFAQIALAEITNITAESRDFIFNEHQKVVGDARRRAKFESPPMGGFSRGGGGSGGNGDQPKAPNSPMEAGQAILNIIGARG